MQIYGHWLFIKLDSYAINILGMAGKLLQHIEF